MTAEHGNEGAPALDPQEPDTLDGRHGRAVIVPAQPRGRLVALATALGRAGWVVADSADPGLAFFVGAPGDARAVAIVCTGERATPPGVVLWLDAEGTTGVDERAGVAVVHRREVLMWHEWRGEGETLVGEAADLAEAVGRPDDQVGVRALLRRQDVSAGDVLADLVALTGLPQQALQLLTTTVVPAGAEVLVAKPPRSTWATTRALSRALPEPRWLAVERRWGWVFPAALCLYFAVRALLASTAGFGEPGDDVGFAVLATITGGVALFLRWRWRRLRRRREGGSLDA